MKLIHKITLFYLAISFVVFLIGYLITYQVIKREIDLEQQRFLRERLTSALRMIERRPPTKSFEREKISIIPLKGEVSETHFMFSDTLVMHQSLERMEPHIKLDVVRKVGDTYYKISMYDLIIEEDDIEEGIRESLVKMYLILIGVVLLLAAISSYWLLKPFNLTLEKIKNFNLKGEEQTKFGKSRTTEFNKLNRFLDEMTQKMKKDYLALKEFTENASHEMQTPIAIATGKLELLLESDNLNDKQIMLVTSAQDSIRRMSKIGNALSLLAKIENREFEQIESINFSELVEKLLFDFKELIELKGINVQEEVAKDVFIRMDSTLAAILVTNLLQNAIRHNKYQGEIYVYLDDHELSITNTGAPLTLDPAQMFDRFKKNDQSRESVGLGLAIVKKICEINGFQLDYKFEQEKHSLIVSF
jgi:signal transduction histidine kinase